MGASQKLFIQHSTSKAWCMNKLFAARADFVGSYKRPNVLFPFFHESCLHAWALIPQKGIIPQEPVALPFPCVFITQPSIVLEEQPILFKEMGSH